MLAGYNNQFYYLQLFTLRHFLFQSTHFSFITTINILLVSLETFLMHLLTTPEKVYKNYLKYEKCVLSTWTPYLQHVRDKDHLMLQHRKLGTQGYLPQHLLLWTLLDSLNFKLDYIELLWSVLWFSWSKTVVVLIINWTGPNVGIKSNYE